MFWGELCTPYFHQSFKAIYMYSYFRIIGIICSYYLDGTFILGRTFQETLEHTEIVFDTLVVLGFVPIIPKCSLIPSTRIRHLGFYIDSIKMTVELPQDKIDTIVDLLWWIKCIHVNCSKPIKPRTPSVLLFSDASDEGFGAHVTSLSDGSILDFTQGNWSPIESYCHFNVKEIMAVKFAIPLYRDCLY